jgi:hypothetical protein
MTGLRLMQHGWPQGFVVTALRRARPELEKQHARILRQDPSSLFDREAIRARARPGDLVVDNTDPVFLAIIPRQADEHSIQSSCAVCRGQDDLMKFVRKQAGPGQGWTMFELVSAAHALSSELAKTAPRKRGRA